MATVGSPFQFTVGPITDVGAHKVRALGPGLEKGEVFVPSRYLLFQLVIIIIIMRKIGGKN